MSEQTIAVATRESKQQSRSSQWILDLVVLWFVSLAISGAMLVDIGSRNPAYLHDFRININPDAGHYLVLGHNILENHVFSRASSPPFVPDALRTPVYPVVVGAVTAVWNEPLAVYALQMMLQLAVIGIVYAFCRIAFSRPIAIIAGTFVATDLAMAVGNFESMSEPVFVFLETAGVFVWICALRSEMSVRRRWYMMILSGILLGTATLTRPSGQFLPIVLGAAEAFYFARRRNWLAVRQLVCAVALSYVVVVPWCVRNHLVFGIPRTTYVDSVNLVHFVGASAYAVEHGTTLDEAQAQIEREFQLPKFAATYNYWKFGLRPKEIDAAYRTAAPQIVTRYPLALLKSEIIGVGKALFGHNVGTYSVMTNREWGCGGLSQLARGRLATAFDDFAQRPQTLTTMMCWQVIHAIVVAVSAACGMVIAIREPSFRQWSVPIVITFLYQIVMIGGVGIDATVRFRFPVTPAASILAALVWASLQRRMRLNFRIPVVL
jgi:hypothetical protein